MNWNDVISWKYQSFDIPAMSYEKTPAPTPMQLVSVLDPIVQNRKPEVHQYIPSLMGQAPQIIEAQKPQSTFVRFKKGLSVFTLKTFVLFAGIGVFFIFLGNPTLIAGIPDAVVDGFYKFMSIFN